MSLKNIKNWKINLSCLIIILSIFVGVYQIYMSVYSDFEDQRFNFSVTESLKTLDAINKNKIDDLKVSHSLFIISSINNVNLNKIILRSYLCNQIKNINIDNIVNSLNMQTNSLEIEKKQFQKKLKKLKKLCVNLSYK